VVVFEQVLVPVLHTVWVYVPPPFAPVSSV
jgi:hypothetical protein